MLILTLPLHEKGLHQVVLFSLSNLYTYTKSCPRAAFYFVVHDLKSDGTGAITVTSSDCPYGINVNE